KGVLLAARRRARHVPGIGHRRPPTILAMHASDETSEYARSCRSVDEFEWQPALLAVWPSAAAMPGDRPVRCGLCGCGAGVPEGDFQAEHLVEHCLLLGAREVG